MCFIIMEKNLYYLSSNEAIVLLRQAELRLGISASAIEKDYWICWLLQRLFLLPQKMAFKGGTSLSRVYNIIARYSEDIDITVDFENFLPNVDITSIIRSQIKKISKKLIGHLVDYLQGTVRPYLQHFLVVEGLAENFELVFDETAHAIKFYYPSVLEPAAYLRDHVLIEFGVRNSTEPSRLFEMYPLLKTKAVEEELAINPAIIEVLSPIRTFWEKIILIHVQCHRGKIFSSPDRLSRHWYDLVMLMKADLALFSNESLEILRRVISYEKAFYYSSYAHYEDCLNGNVVLVPSKKYCEALEADYMAMIEAGMFFKDPPGFSVILDQLITLQKEVCNFIHAASLTI